MSRIEIPPDLYYKLLTDSTAYWVRRGMDLIAARGMAQDQMNNAYITSLATIEAEGEADAAEKGIYS